MLFYSKDGYESSQIETFVAMLGSLWVTRNKSIYKDAPGHTEKVLRYLDLGLADLGFF